MSRCPRRWTDWCLLGLLGLVLVALFSDLVVSTRPIVAWTDDGVFVLPTVTARAAVANGKLDAALEAGDPFVIWPVLVTSAADVGAGTDPVRVFAWWVTSTRTTIFAALACTLFAAAFGLMSGAFAGLGPAIGDMILTRLIEVAGALPAVVLVALLQASGAFDPLTGFIVAVAALKGLEIAKITRTRIQELSAQEFVLAARALGASELRLFRSHLVPHVLGTAAVSAIFTSATVVGLHAALAFIGLGDPHSPSWGLALARAPASGAWPIAIAAAISVVGTVSALYAAGESLDRRLAPEPGGRVCIDARAD